MLKRKYFGVVIGWSLRAAIFAYKSGYLFIMTRKGTLPPQWFMPPDYDLSLFEMNNEKIMLFSLYNGNKIIGIQQQKVYERILWLLGAKGLLVDANQYKNLKVDPENGQIRINTNQSINICCDNIFYFEGELPGLSTKCDSKKMVVDWIATSKGAGAHQYDFHLSDDDMARELWFVSKRVSRAFKNIVAVSYLEDINDPNTSDSIVRLKVRQILEEDLNIINKRGRLGLNYIEREVFNTGWEISETDVIDMTKFSLEKTQCIPFATRDLEELPKLLESKNLQDLFNVKSGNTGTDL